MSEFAQWISLSSWLDRFDRPAALWLLLLVVVLVWLSRRSLAGLGPIRSRVCLGTRALLITLLVLVIAGAHRITRNDNLTVLYVLDQSRSISPEARRQAETFIQQTSSGMRPEDRAAVLTFDGRTSIEQLPSRSTPQGGIHVPMPFAEGGRPDRTNIAQALRMAEACALESTNNRIVLLSDGNQNVGDALEEAQNARANTISVDIVPLRRAEGAEVIFEQLRTPAYANLNEQVPLRLILSSDRRTTGTIVVYQRVGQDEDVVNISGDAETPGQRIALDAGRNAFTIRLPIQSARAHEFRAEFIPDDSSADVIASNNIARAFTNVEGPQRLLYIGTDRDREDDALLIEALMREDVDVDWQLAESVNLTPAAVQDFSAIILSNTGANLFSAEQQRALASYVRDLGGGLIMIGGDDSFGAGGWQGSVVEEIMPVRFDVDAIRQIPRGALAIVMHSCEMPEGNKWGIEVAVAALKTLSRLDYYGVVGWQMGGTGWEVQMQVASNKEAIIRKIRKMQNGDMPDFHSSMNLAYKGLIAQKDAAQRHMIIISDGDASAPGTALIANMIGHKVTCSTVTVFPHGGGVQTMQDIAEKTGGDFYLLNRPGDEKRLPKIFVKEAKIVRRPLLRDETFTPKTRPSMSDIMVGIDTSFPELKGYVVTTPRKIVDVEMPLVTERGDPLLAHWQVGFGRTVAFTSGRWRHWGANWPQWPGFSKLWAQTVRWAMRQGTAADYDTTLTLEGDTGHLIIESLDDQRGFANFRRFVGRVIRPDGTAFNLPLEQTGPGKYEAKFKAPDMGTYLVNVTSPQTGDDKPVVIRTGATLAYSPEFRERFPNEALLRDISQTAEGRILSLADDAERVFAHNMPPAISRTPAWDDLLKLSIIILLLDVAFRRVAIDPIRMLAAARQYIAGLAGRFGAGRRAQETLTDLKTARERIRAERDKASSEKSGTPPARSAGPAATTKFEAPAGATRPTGDMPTTAAEPGEKKAAPKKAPPEQKDKKDEAGSESTTSRLLRAKRRARPGDDEKKQ